MTHDVKQAVAHELMNLKRDMTALLSTTDETDWERAGYQSARDQGVDDALEVIDAHLTLVGPSRLRREDLWD